MASPVRERTVNIQKYSFFCDYKMSANVITTSGDTSEVGDCQLKNHGKNINNSSLKVI